MWAGWLVWAIVAAPPPDVIEAQPLVEPVRPNDSALRVTYGLASDARGLLYAGGDGRITVYDGHDTDALDLPGLGIVWSLRADGDRLWYAAEGGVGYVPLDERAGLTARPLRVEGLDRPRAGTVLLGADAVRFGTHDGALIRCPRPVDAARACTVQRLEGDGFSRFVQLGDTIWAQAKGRGWLQLDGDRFVRRDAAAPFLEDRLFAHAPGRRAGEHLLGFFRAGLFWWSPQSGLQPVDGWSAELGLVLAARRLRDGRYAIGTARRGLVILGEDGAPERWRAPDVLPANAVNDLVEVSPGVLWTDAGFGTVLVLADERVRRVPMPEASEVRGLAAADGVGYVLGFRGLYRIETEGGRPARLRLVEPFELARSLHRDGDRWLVGSVRGIEAVSGAAPARSVWTAQEVVDDLASHPARPDELLAGLPNAVVVLARAADGTYRERQRFGVPGTARDLCYLGPDEVWFRAGRNHPRRLLRVEGAWRLDVPGGLEVVDAPGYTYLLRGGDDLWMTWGRTGLRRWDPEARRFTPDRRVAARLGLTYPQPILHYRMNAPEVLVAERMDGDVLRGLWVGVRRPDQAPHEARWSELPPWYLGDMQTFHIERGWLGGRVAFGGTDAVYLVAPDAAPLEGPPRPLLRVFRTRTASGARDLPDVGARLEWSERSVELRFASPDPHPGSRVEYRTRLARPAGAWSPWDRSPRRVFDLLPSGPVRIEIQARDETHRTSPLRALTLEVALHPLASGPALLTYVVTGGLCLGLGLLLTTRRLQARAARLREELVRQRTAEALARGQARLLSETLSGLADQPNLGTYLRQIMLALARELGAEAVFLWIEGDEGMQPELRTPEDAPWPDLASAPAPLDGAPVDDTLWLPLAFEGVALGRIAVVGLGAPGPTEPSLQLARALAAQATLACRLSALADDERARAVSEERVALSREVHDSLAQGFVGTGLRIEQALAAAERAGPDEGWRRNLESALELNRQGLSEARRVIQLLRTEAHQDGGLEPLLQSLEPRVAAMGLGFALTTSGEALDPGARPAFELYRIAHEAVSNALRHARAQRVQVVLTYADDGLTVTVDDDGTGIDRTRPAGIGLRSMQERADLIGARLTVAPGPERGTRVRVAWSRPAAG